MWETISDLNVHVQVAKACIIFRRYTLSKILPKIGTGLILLAPSVYIYCGTTTRKYMKINLKFFSIPLVILIYQYIIFS